MLVCNIYCESNKSKKMFCFGFLNIPFISFAVLSAVQILNYFLVLVNQGILSNNTCVHRSPVFISDLRPLLSLYALRFWKTGCSRVFNGESVFAFFNSVISNDNQHPLPDRLQDIRACLEIWFAGEHACTQHGTYGTFVTRVTFMIPDS